MINCVDDTDSYIIFQVNLNKQCPFWSDDSRCAMRNCAVDVCSEVMLYNSLVSFAVDNGVHIILIDHLFEKHS